MFGVGVGDVVDQGAEGGGAGSGDGLFTTDDGCRVDAGEQAGGDGFGVAFDTGELAGEEDGWLLSHPFRKRRGMDGARSEEGGIVRIPRSQKRDLGHPAFQTQTLVEQERGLEIGVAVNLAVAEEAGVFEAGNEAEDVGLCTEFEMVLKADKY